MNLIYHISNIASISAKRAFLLGTLLMLLTTACDEDDPPSTQMPVNVGSASIKVTVKHLYDTGTLADSAVSGAAIRLFDNRQSFMDDFGPEATRTTNADGEALFEFRADDYYWIRAAHPHPDLGVLTDSVSTPSSSFSFVELRYY